MKPIGVIVGNICGGRYEVAQMLKEAGIYVLDFDKLRSSVFPEFRWDGAWDAEEPDHTQYKANMRVIVDVAMTIIENVPCVLNICDDLGAGFQCFKEEERALIHTSSRDQMNWFIEALDTKCHVDQPDVLFKFGSRIRAAVKYAEKIGRIRESCGFTFTSVKEAATVIIRQWKE